MIGATGHVGRHVLSRLSAADAQVRALTRNANTASLPGGIEVVEGDLTDPGTLNLPLDGIDTVFLVWTAPREAVAGAMDAIAKRARRIVFLSAPLKTPHPFFQQPNPLRDQALEIERRIEQSGLEWTFLRPGMFSGYATHLWGPQIRRGDVVRWPYPEVATAPIDERDIAAVAVQALTQEGHAGQEYVLTGPESLSQAELILTIGRAIGRRLRVEEIPPEEARRVWAQQMPGIGHILLDAWSAAAGLPAHLTSTVCDITGTPARTFEQWAAEHTSGFQKCE